MRRAPDAIPVLLYHSIGDWRDDPWAVSTEDFSRDMEAVASSGRVSLTAADHARLLESGAAPEQPSIVITVDDGYADFEKNAVPILQKHGLSCTLFMTSGWLGRPHMLSREGLRDVATLSGVEVGAHTCTHPHLDVIPRRAAVQEVSRCRDEIQEATGVPVESFAYPHGSQSATTRSIVRDCGYGSAYAVRNALSHASDDPFAIARFTVQGRTGRGTVQNFINGSGIPVVQNREKLRTKAYRVVRFMRARFT